MASIKKRPDGSWRARFRDPDGREHAHHAPTKAAAQKWLDSHTASLVRGDYVDPKAGRITVNEYAEEWQARRSWSPATADRIGRELRLHILPKFGNWSLMSIRRAHVEEWVKGLPLAPSSAHMVFETFMNMLSAADDDERISKNPAKGARLAKVEHAPIVPLSAAQVVAIADAAADHIHAAVVVVATTGLRQGELFGLVGDRIDYLRREVRVDQQLWTPPKGSPILKAPKSANSYRTVALSAVTVDALAAHVAEFGEGDDGLVFHTKGRPVGRSMASKYIRLARTAANMPNVTWHDFRHHHASVLLSHGVSPALVAERLGHDVKTLMATYAHVIRADDDRVRAIIDADFGHSADFSRTGTG
jgi:integrase